ncbi:RNA polymerase sigma subunit ECF family protein [Amylibacter ulvae]|uniref:RNA polymerase sigma subunit ECF family protein n=2 Tax=Paramylibacter ulvae TaxID=1651968 RepID=A0ABQ3D7D6_9RHOB|nr:RNA polymerase sigma subunit ECF family protein [Amylibacter ulvae]
MMAFDATNEVSDDALMVLYANGDPQAASQLASRHVSRVLALAYRMLNDRAEADDVAQDAMLRLWKIAPKWRQGEAKVSTWLYRVASNLCTDRLRKRRSTGLDDVPEIEDDAPSVETDIMTRDRAVALRNALQQLPERQRLAVTLRHIEELANPEIAEIMDISVEAVESLTARGKRGLAELLSDQKSKIGLET